MANGQRRELTSSHLKTVITAVNDEGGAVNVAFDAQGEDTIPNIMKRHKAAGQPFMLVVDENCKA